MSDDFVRREEHNEAIRRLDQADSELRASVTVMERVLRTEFVAGMNAMEERVTSRLDGLGEHLTAQDKMWLNFYKSGRNWFVGVGGTALALGVAHYVFHVPI